MWTRGHGSWPLFENTFNLVVLFLELMYFLGDFTRLVNESFKINGFKIPLCFIWLRKYTCVQWTILVLHRELLVLCERGDRTP